MDHVNTMEQVRTCSYNPEKHLTKIEFSNNPNPQLYLPVDERVKWFQIYCAENELKRCAIIEERAETLCGNIIQVHALVQIEGEVAGQGVASDMLTGEIDHDKKNVQSIATAAKGRALANAGFGTAFCSANAYESGGEEFPCDGGIKMTNYTVERDPENPMLVNTVPMQEPKANAVTAQKATGTSTSKQKTPATREEALNYVVDVNCKVKGMTLSDVQAQQPGQLWYLANNERFKNTTAQAAAKLVHNFEYQQ